MIDALLQGAQRRREAIETAMAFVKGWATSALSTRANFIAAAGTVDLVVVDEASQCTLAAVLPLAYRAKRLVIVGDPQQLPPVVTVGDEELRALADQAGVPHAELAEARHTYGEDSAYTSFEAAFRTAYDRDAYLLQEHYRCHPEIIQFCNEQFYDNRLTILTGLDPDPSRPSGLEWREVDGQTERGRSGSVLNHAEAQSVSDWVVTSGLPSYDIGVVTPFRAQARLIRELLHDRGLGEVRVGTAHAFQGGECDTMVFSTVLSAGAFQGTANWLEGERNLVNVAVSRARRHLVVFGNRAQLTRLNARTLLALAEAATGKRTQASRGGWSQATARLHAALDARGVPADLGDVVEGYPLSITIAGRDGRRINVEIDEFPDGDPNGQAQRQAATRDAVLEDLGWTVVRIPAWRAYLEPDAVTDEILAATIR